MFYRIEAFGRKHGWILLGSTQADTYFVFCQILDIAFENHFIGDIICIAIPFIKDNSISLTEIRKKSFTFKSSISDYITFRDFIFSNITSGSPSYGDLICQSIPCFFLLKKRKSKSGFMFIGRMILLYFQIINDFSGLTFLRQCREPQRSCPCTSFIIHITGF